MLSYLATRKATSIYFVYKKSSHVVSLVVKGKSQNIMVVNSCRMQNSMVVFIFSVLNRKHPFWANLVQKIKIVSLN